MIPSAVIIFAIDNPGFLRMKFEFTLFEPFFEALQQLFSLFFRSAVDDCIIRISCPRILGLFPCHPLVERVVHEQICKYRTDDTALRRAGGPLFFCSRPSFGRGRQPSLDVENDPRAVRMFSNCFYEQLMVDVVEQTFNVKLQHPVISPASGSGHSNRIICGFSRSVPVGVRMKDWFH